MRGWSSWQVASPSYPHPLPGRVGYPVPGTRSAAHPHPGGRPGTGWVARSVTNQPAVVGPQATRRPCPLPQCAGRYQSQGRCTTSDLGAASPSRPPGRPPSHATVPGVPTRWTRSHEPAACSPATGRPACGGYSRCLPAFLPVTSRHVRPRPDLPVCSLVLQVLVDRLRVQPGAPPPCRLACLLSSSGCPVLPTHRSCRLGSGWNRQKVRPHGY